MLLILVGKWFKPSIDLIYCLMKAVCEWCSIWWSAVLAQQSTGSEWYFSAVIQVGKWPHVHHMTNRKWVNVQLWTDLSFQSLMDREWVIQQHILWKAVWFLWPTASEWHCTICERKSDCIFSYDQQEVSDIAHLWKTVWSHLHMYSHDEQLVSDIANFVKGSLITPCSLWPTACEWCCGFCEWQSNYMFSYDH